MKKEEKKVEMVKEVKAPTLWDLISDKKLDMFSLPEQTVAKYFTLVVSDEKKCTLVAKVSSAITALENAFPELSVELVDKYTVVTRK
jgi:hypothetical protein